MLWALVLEMVRGRRAAYEAPTWSSCRHHGLDTLSIGLLLHKHQRLRGGCGWHSQRTSLQLSSYSKSMAVVGCVPTLGVHKVQLRFWLFLNPQFYVLGHLYLVVEHKQRKQAAACSACQAAWFMFSVCICVDERVACCASQPIRNEFDSRFRPQA